MYKYYQPNKKDIKDKRTDCIIRALTKLTDKNWIECFEMLIPHCIELQSVPSDKVIIEAWLKDNGYKYTGISNAKGTKRPTVEKFSKANKSKTLMVVAHHCVTCEDGNYFDTWDSGQCCLYGYWTKNDK